MPVLWIVIGSPSAGDPRVAPQPAVVVEHLRLGEHELGEREGAAGVARQQRARGQRGGGVDVDGHRGAPYDRGMAKKKSASRADAVRDAVDQAFKSQIPRERISELLDEIGNTAGRLRGAVDELRPASEAESRRCAREIRRCAPTSPRCARASSRSRPSRRRPRRRRRSATADREAGGAKRRRGEARGRQARRRREAFRRKAGRGAAGAQVAARRRVTDAAQRPRISQGGHAWVPSSAARRSFAR